MWIKYTNEKSWESIKLKHEKFNYASMDDFKSKISEMKLNIPISDNTDVLFDKVAVDSTIFENRFVIQPMEGCDGSSLGAPEELTYRRYKRFAQSGAALIWMEAVALSPEARANPRQLQITKDNVDAYKKLIETIKEEGLRTNGFQPKVIMQATHSGRNSKPNGFPEPIIAHNKPLFEKNAPLDSTCIISDDDLKRFEEKFGEGAKLAQEAGFDGIDIKCCHGYLASELLSAYDRPGEFGGSFENRTRLLVNGVKNANAAVSGDFIVTSRLGIYDGFEYPYGFGVKEGNGIEVDLTEPKKLISILHNELGMNLINITIGNPYVNPHVNRPYDTGVCGFIPDQHPLEGVERMLYCAGEIQKEFPDMTIISSGYSYLRQYAPNVGAALVENGLTSMIGFGRESFAYPEFIQDLKKNGAMNEKKCCITCSKCTELMRMGTVAGCVIRDKEIYVPKYTEAKAKLNK